VATILLPATVLVCWSLIMLLWTAQTRFPAMKARGLRLGELAPGGRGKDLDGVLPDAVNWKAHNYAHLMEQPTVFYPTVIILALVGHTLLDVVLAWAYVGLRVVHSLWQARVNTIPVRMQLFKVSTFCLIALAVRSVWMTYTSL
jgi:hypothetical protein